MFDNGKIRVLSLPVSIRVHTSFVTGMHVQVKDEMVTVDSSLYQDGVFSLPFVEVKLGGQKIAGPTALTRLDTSSPFSIGKLKNIRYSGCCVIQL